ncbi:hypothetical protein Pgy4_11287, partial [Pseudomonas savastanoi pv. glycinea str. race 4]
MRNSCDTPPRSTLVDKDEARPSCETARYRYGVEFHMSLSSGLIAAVSFPF